ncbi:MAG: hypothetical protein JNL74_05730 [Fibrobacteres bacterium]|nr:hypothetical protein [Fibrobacterota bacterium]
MIKFLIMSAICISCFSEVPSSLLPADNAVAGWVKIGQSNCVSGTAANSSDLYKLIDGGADVYINRGFAGCALTGYSNGTDTICIEIYDQSRKDSALSLFRYYEFGEYEKISGIGDTAKMDTSPAFANRIEMVAGRYFIRMDIQNKSRTLVPTAKALAAKISEAAIAVEKRPSQGATKASINVLPLSKNGSYKISVTGAYGETLRVSILNCTGTKITEVPLIKSGNIHEGTWNGYGSNGKKTAPSTYIAQIRVEQKLISTKFTGY